MLSAAALKLADAMFAWLRSVLVRSMSFVGIVALLPTFIPDTVASKPPSSLLAMLELVSAKVPAVVPRKLTVSPDATLALLISRVALLALAISRPVTPVAVMLVLMTSGVDPPVASTAPAPEIGPFIAPKPLIVAPELLTMLLPLRVPPEMVIVPPELSVMVVVELSVSPLAMVIVPELVRPLLAVRVLPLLLTAIVAPLALVTAPLSAP